jgi:hypothetical protein
VCIVLPYCSNCAWEKLRQTLIQLGGLNSSMYCLSVSRNGHPAPAFEFCSIELKPSEFFRG